MSAKSRILRLPCKSSIRNSPLVSIANRELKNAVASELDSEPVDTSLSSVFTDNEVIFAETKKRKARTRMTKKVRNMEDFKDFFMDPASANYSDTDLRRGEIGSTKTLAEVGCNIVSTANRELKNSVASELDSEPIDTSFSSVFTDNEVVFAETKKKKSRKTKKVRNTEDFNDCFKKPESANGVDSDTDLRRREIRSTKSLAEVGLNIVSSANRELKNSVASELDPKLTNTSLSSAFTDNEVVSTKPKKKDTFMVRDCWSMDSDTELNRVETKSTKSLAEVFLLKSKNIKKKKTKPLFSLPNVTYAVKYDSNDTADESTNPLLTKAKSKRKIRYTQDLNSIANDQRDSDVAAKPKPKRTKKARLPSFLPTVDIEDENKRRDTNSAESAVTDPDNKENDTNTETDSENNNRKRRRPRKSTNILVKNKEKVDIDDENIRLDMSNSAESAVTDSDNKENGTNIETESENNSRKTRRQRKPTNSLVKNEEKVSLDTKKVAVPSENTSKSKNARKSKNHTFEIIHTPNKSSTSCNYENSQVTEELMTHSILKGNTSGISSQNASKSKNYTFEIVHSPNQSSTSCNYENSQVTEELMTHSILKGNTSGISSQNASNTPNKTGNTSDFENECLEISLKQDIPSVRKSSRRSALNVTVDLPGPSYKSEAACFNGTREIVPNQEFFNPTSEPKSSTALKTKTTKRTTLPLRLEETSNNRKATRLTETRRSTRNRDSNLTRTTESVPELESSSPISESTTNAVHRRTSTRTSNAVDRGATFELEPGMELSNDISESINLNDPFSPAKSFNNESSKDTYDIVYSTHSSVASDEEHVANITVIDLTESPEDDLAFSTSEKAKRSSGSSSDKGSGDKRKSSFDVSFKAKKDRRNPETILDHLNITRRDSQRSVSKKSSTGLKYSTGSDSEDCKPRRNYVTLRRGRECHTMVDIYTGDSLDASTVQTTSGKGGLKKYKNSVKLNETEDYRVVSDKGSPEDEGACSLRNTATKGRSQKKSILKKSMGTTTRSTRRDTYEVAECFYETLEAGTVSLRTEGIPNVILEAEPQRDIFDLVSKTPTVDLGKMLIGSGDSVIMDSSILNETNQSTTPRLTRTSTYTKLENTPLPTRKSTRKRWSQVGRTPISDYIPEGNASIIAPDQPTESTVDQSKSVNIKTPVLSPRKKWNNATPKQANAAEKTKSVKIQTPFITPNIRPHSPLVRRKTPGPHFSGADDSILSGNFCAYNPSRTSTPQPKKKEVSLLKRVLTNEESKSEKSVGKHSVRSKMPNFSKIHQRQNEKLENVKEMMERKAVRAQYLLSGSKPPANTSANFFEKESRKQLKFSPNKAEAASSTAANISGLTFAQAKSKVLSKPLQRMLDKRVSLEKKKKEKKSKVPVAIAKPVLVPKAEPKPPTKPQSKGVSRFGFRLQSDKDVVTKKEQIKAVTTKSNITVNRTESNRKQLVGVRSNRRFELLMKMRESKK